MKLIKVVFVITFSVFLITAACTSGGTPDAADDPTPEAPATPEKTPGPLEIGQAKYKEYCTKCHKDDGTGGKVEIDGKTLKPENLTEESMVKEPDSEYLETMEKGLPEEGMPSFKDEMTADEMKAVLKYIRETLQSG